MSAPQNSSGETAFQDAYATLNAGQREAVDTIDGPVLVVAGPGTGKTQVLTLRIANILRQTDAAPEDILALTFTESGARAMRERLRRYLSSDAYRVPIHTFHGLANQLIGQYPDAYPNIIGGQAVGDVEKIGCIESILADADIRLLRPAGNQQFYVPHIIRMLSTLKQEYYTPTRLRELITEQEARLAETPRLHEKGAHAGKVRSEYAALEKSIAKNHELAFVYDRYQAWLAAEQYYDYEDMLVQTVEALAANEDMLRDLQERYQYVLADEHQDINGVQNALLEALVSFHEHPNIFAVGDEKQAIYRFQGASLENFLKFSDVFPDVRTVSLTENYRSGQPILDCAHSLVAVEDGPLQELRQPLTATAVETATVTLRSFAHQAVEDGWLLETVHAALAAGTDPTEIAVIVRTNREVEHLAALLRNGGISVSASADGDILQHPITEQVHALLRAVTDPSDSEALAQVFLAPYWGIPFATQACVLAAQRHNRSLADVLSDTDTLAKIGVTDPAPVLRVVTVLQQAREANVSVPPHRVLQQLLTESGLLEHVIAHDAGEGTRVLRRLYDEVETLVRHEHKSTLEAVRRVFTTRRQYGLPLQAPYINAAANAVSVLTAHKAKGLEYDTVLLPYVTDATWGGRKLPEYFKLPLVRREVQETVDALDDERRLLYVAMTRAKRTLHISSSDQSVDGRERTASRLLTELDATSYQTVTTEGEAEQFSVTDNLVATPNTNTIATATVAALFAERGFSATSLNNYLESPWKYVGKNLLRLPEVQGLPLLYGTAVHDVLEWCTQQYTQTGSLPTMSDVTKRLRSALGRQPLHAEEYSQLHERALEALTVYCDHLATQLPARTHEEVKLSVVLPTGLSQCPEVRLTGKLDRLDYDANGQLLRVVDYKTGKPKTRNAILGQTKNDDGGYKRQLVFYALLLELYDQPEMFTRDMTLSFIEPTAQGQVKEESFTVTEEEIVALKEEIIAAAQTLTDGSWQELPCDPAVVPFCSLLNPPT